MRDTLRLSREAGAAEVVGSFRVIVTVPPGVLYAVFGWLLGDAGVVGGVGSFVFIVAVPMRMRCVVIGQIRFVNMGFWG